MVDLYLQEFLTVAVVHFLAVASPGPDFAIILKQSVNHGRVTGLWTALGIGSGILVHVGYCILGIGLLIASSQVAFDVVKYLGAGYLFYIGLCAIRAERHAPLEVASDKANTPSARQSFLLGFMTNALNPKATLFFLAVFSVTISSATPNAVKFLYGLWMAVITAAWFSCLSLFFSRNKVRSAFHKFGHWFERIMGLALILLGAKLALTSIK